MWHRLPYIKKTVDKKIWNFGEWGVVLCNAMMMGEVYKAAKSWIVLECMLTVLLLEQNRGANFWNRGAYITVVIGIIYWNIQEHIQKGWWMLPTVHCPVLKSRRPSQWITRSHYFFWVSFLFVSNLKSFKSQSLILKQGSWYLKSVGFFQLSPLSMAGTSILLQKGSYFYKGRHYKKYYLTVNQIITIFNSCF